jgi:hypothetical protein
MRFLCVGQAPCIAFLCARRDLAAPAIPEGTMLDIAFVMLGLAAFAALLGYAVLCERL